MKAGRALAFLVPLSLASSLAFAQPAPPPEKKAAPAREGSAAPAQGLVVFIDPVTGKIRQPEPSEIGALTAPPAATAAPAVEPPLLMKIGPGGAVGVVLDSRYESFVVVTKKPDGTLATECVTGGRSADAAVAAAAKPAERKTKEAPRVP
ncbi:MAG: hypothetical protein IPL89_06190 [Acidobacteria bacterium]|nr:hypothetical protein [Acidobacteriota bacterium]